MSKSSEEEETSAVLVTLSADVSRKMSGLKSRMIVVPKDATTQQVRDIYDDFAKTYDEVCSYIIIFSIDQ